MRQTPLQQRKEYTPTDPAGPGSNDQASAPPAPDQPTPPPQYEQQVLAFWGPRDATEQPRRKLWYEFLCALGCRGASRIAVAFVLDAEADAKGRTTKSLTRASADSGISISTFRRVVRFMEQHGLAWVEQRFDPRTGRQTTSRIHLNQGWKRHPRTYRRNVSVGGSPGHSDTPPRSQGHPLKSVRGEVNEDRLRRPAADSGTSRAIRPTTEKREQPADHPIPEELIGALAARSREHDVPFAEAAVRLRVARGELTTADLRHRLEHVLPPRMNTEDPAAVERWNADVAAGRIDRSRKGGYPAPPDDPRFTTEDPDDAINVARRQGHAQGLIDGRRAQARDAVAEAIERSRRRFTTPDPGDDA